MLKQNEDLPDIEKLGRHEFDLDIEEQNRLQAEADAEVNRVCNPPKRSFNRLLIVMIFHVKSYGLVYLFSVYLLMLFLICSVK